MSSTTNDDIPDWAKIKAFKETFQGPYESDELILRSWCTSTRPMKALARRIARDDEPPLSQELLIWREAWGQRFRQDLEKYRSGALDSSFSESSAVVIAIKLALEGFGKDGVTDNG